MTRGFAGLSAFPLTPLADDAVDEAAFARLIERLVAAGADSITALGSTGSYAYLSRRERAVVARIAAASAGTVPVFVGIGALRTSQVLAHAADAQDAGARGLLLAPVSYQPLTPDDVYGLFETVTAQTDLPVILYDNPVTTGFTFDDGLYAAITRLPGIAAVKIPGVPGDATAARARLDRLRGLIPAGVSIGVSGDRFAAVGLHAGCDAWYSVVGGTFPRIALRLTRAAQRGDAAESDRLSARLQPLWDCFAAHGSLRVMAALAEHLGLVRPGSLPLPLRGLSAQERARIAPIAADLAAAEAEFAAA